MTDSFRQTFITFSIIALFVFAAISFIVQIQSENDAPSSILENELINRTFISLDQEISSSTNTSKGSFQAANSSKTQFESEIPTPGFGSLIIFAIVGVAQTFTSIITTFYNVIIVLPISLLGVPTQIASILGSILMMSLIFLAWRVYRVGS